MAPFPYCCAPPSRPAGCAVTTDCQLPGEYRLRNPARVVPAIYRRLFSTAHYRWRRRAGVSRKAGFPAKTRRLRDAATVGAANRTRRGSATSGARPAGIAGAVRPVGIDVERPGAALDDLARDHDLFDAFQARQVEHGVEQDHLHDRAQAARAGLAVDRLAGNRGQRLVGQGQIHRLHLEHALVLLDQRVLRLGEDALERRLVEVLQRRDHGKPADEFRDEAVFQQILRLDFAKDFALLAILGRRHPGGEADRGGTAARRDDLLEAGESSAADEQDIGGVDLEEFLLRMLAAALRRDTGDGGFHYLEQRLLHALARHVAGDRGVVGLARYLLDRVDIDNAE